MLLDIGMIHLYCLAIQARFYSDVVECWPVTQMAGFDPRSGKNVISIFSPVTCIYFFLLRCW